MVAEILRRMTGAELLLLNIISSRGQHQLGIEAELGRRALHGAAKAPRVSRHVQAANHRGSVAAVA